MALQWIDAARNNLSVASNNYASIQKQLDRYNKVFETFANASPETQIRAASVMRQAIDEYNWLKRQQQENALKIYEAQSWVDYYNNSKSGGVQPVQLHSIQVTNTGDPIQDRVTPQPTEEIQIISTATPGVLNNNAPAAYVETNALDTNRTMNVTSTPTYTYLTNLNNQNNRYNPTVPAWISNITNSQQPKFEWTTIRPTTQQYNVTSGSYWPGSVAGFNNNTYVSTQTVSSPSTKFNPTRRVINLRRSK